MRDLLTPIFLGFILLIAAWFRLDGILWDDLEHYHPDERYISWIATSIETDGFNPYYWPEEVKTTGVFTPQAQQRDFAYGHLPLYLGVITTRLAERLTPLLEPIFHDYTFIDQYILNGKNRVEFDHITVIGRLTTALLDIGTTLLIYILAKQLFDATVGLISAALYAVTVLAIQLAHFWTVDPPMTFFTTLTLTCLVIGLQRPRFGYFGAIAIGLAIGSKFSAIMLGLPLLIWAFIDQNHWLRRLIISGLLVLIAFALTNPYALLDYSCDVFMFDRNVGNCYLYNITKQSGMVDGSADLGFTRQYAGTLPFIYQIEMLTKWGAGALPALLMIGGFCFLLKNLWPKSRSLRPTATQMPYFIISGFLLPYFIINGQFFVKFMRYMLPIIPLLIILGTAWIMRWRPLPRALFLILLFVDAGTYALAFRTIYDQPHPWTAASRYIYETIPSDTMILHEQWGDRLPLTLTNDDGSTDSAREFGYRQAPLTFLTYPDEKDTQDRLDDNLSLIAIGDYIVVDSNRTYTTVSRQADRFPLSGQFYPLLFDGSLGYEPIFVAQRTPRLGFVGGLAPDNFRWAGLTAPSAVQEYWQEHKIRPLYRADESFALYDQSLVMIFENVGNLSQEEMLQLFELDR